MSKFVSVILSLFSVKRQISRLESKIDQLSSRRAKSDEEIAARFAALSELESRLLADLVKTRQTLADVQILNRKLDEALDGTRDKLKTAEEITIPGLVAANQMFVQRWEAESRIHAMRATLADMNNQPRES